MLISHEKATSKALFSLEKQLNVDFTRMRDHRDAHFT